MALDLTLIGRDEKENNKFVISTSDATKLGIIALNPDGSNISGGGGGGGAVTIADGADVTLGAKADARSTATDTTAITAMQVLKEISFMEQNPVSRAVTQATGTNLHTVIDSGTITTVSAITAISNALPAGTNVIGHVITDTGSTTAVTGTVAIGGNTITDGATTITAGGTAQTLFTPSNGFAVYNPDPSEDLWISITTTALANGTGSIRVPANGGGYESPLGAKITGAVSIVAATTGHKFTAMKW